MATEGAYADATPARRRMAARKDREARRRGGAASAHEMIKERYEMIGAGGPLRR